MNLVEWRPAPTACNRFEVSSDGRVRNRFNERELTLTTHKSGYQMFSTRSTRKGRARAYKAHRLVALAFLGAPLTDRHQVNHRDGDKANNHVSNLEWVTPAENIRHAHRTGLMRPVRGMQQGSAKLTDDAVRFIRRHYAPTHPHYGCRALAGHFGVSHCTVSRIVNGKLWTHVPDSPAPSGADPAKKKARS